MWENNRPQRPSMVGKRSPRPKMLLINEPDPCAVPCTSQDTAAAAESYMYFNDDICLNSATDFGSFQDDDDAEFPKLCLPKDSPESLKFFDLNPLDNDDNAMSSKLYPPVDSQEHNANGASHLEYHKMIEESLSEDEWFGCQSSVTDWVSFATSFGGATASASFNNFVSFENHMNEEVADNLPQLLHQDEKLEIDNRKKNNEMSQPICLLPSKKYLDHILESDYDVISGNDNLSNLPKEWSNESNKGPGSSLGDASRPSSSAGDQSISLELHNSHVKFKVKSFTVPEFFVEVPETASVGFLKKAILEKATAIIGGEGYLDVLLLGQNTRDENEFIPKAGTSHQNKLQDLNASSPKLSCIPLPPQPQTWCTPSSSIGHQGTTDTSPDSFMSLLGMTFQDNHERLEFRTNVPIANSISSMTATICSKVNGSLDLVPNSQKVDAFKCKKRVVMDENTLDVVKTIEILL